MSAIFNLDWKRLTKRMTAPALRKPRFLALLNLMYFPLQQVHQSFLNFVALKRIELSYTGQTMQLERYLNDRFDPSGRRIKILHEEQEAGVYLYYENEGQDQDFLYFENEDQPPTYLYFEGENNAAIGRDFIVKIPTTLTGQIEQIRGGVKRYKIAGPTYDVTT